MVYIKICFRIKKKGWTEPPLRRAHKYCYSPLHCTY
nr:MAG TPA: hypothetical protein [Caudoviricetes sp.]DAT11944.1 MAG TPA: hypothetical protein [Bacteriophage sp.]